MILSRFFRSLNTSSPSPAMMSFLRGEEISDTGITANLSTTQRIHTAYRCINILSDDIAQMPLQTFEKVGLRLAPTFMPKNIAWLLEYKPNRWQNPFIFKKTAIKWMINWGQSYIWNPPLSAWGQNELIVLPAGRTVQMYDKDGNLWYQVTWEYWEPFFNQEQNPQYYPDVEVTKLLINSDDGITGESVISHARDTLSRQLGNFKTQNRISSKGLNPSGIAWMSGELDKEARKKFKETYEETMHDAGIAIFDPKVTKFEAITMKPVDAQFLESIQATDVEIANFYGVPLYKLNLGKQSYESNAQLDLDYLKTTLNAYLVQWENEARCKWLTMEQQARGFYFKFNRDVLLATDANTRADYLQKKIFSGQLTPNQACEIDDLPTYPAGNKHYIPANMMSIDSAPVTVTNLIGGEDATDQSTSHGNGHRELVGRSGRSSKRVE